MNPPPPQTDAGSTRKLVLILLAVVAVYLFASSRSTLWDRDEPRFARATYEMVESGNYLYPTFNGELRPDKPIMIYWLMSVPVRAFASLGPHAFPARFVAAFGTAFSCLFTFLIARRLYGQRTALWSAGVLASTLLIFMMGTAATADAILLPAMVGALWLFYRALDAGRLSVAGTLGMAGMLGFALLAKGPVGLLPVLVMLVVLLLRKRRGGEPGTRFWPIFGPALVAVALAAGLFLAWAVPANHATDGEFLRLGIGKHVIGRSTSAMESHGGNSWRYLLYLPYYFVVPVFTFFPWTLHMPAAVCASVGGRNGGPISRELVLGWALPVIVLMTFVATKLPHYMLLAFPALAIVTAAFLTGRRGELARWDRKLLRGGIWFYGSVNTALAVALIAAPIFLDAGWIGIGGGVFAAGILLIGGHQVNKHQLREDPAASTPVMVKTAAAAAAVVLIAVLPAIDATKMPYRIARVVTAGTPDDTPVGFCDFREPSLNFYVGRPIEVVGPGQVGKWFDGHDTAALIIPRDLYDRVQPPPAGVRVLGEVTGFNYSNGEPDTVLAVYKPG